MFTKNQRQWKARSLPKLEVENYLQAFTKSGIELAVSHDSYLINLASPDDNNLMKSRQAFWDEIQRCEELKIPYLIFHPGSHVGSGERTGLKMVAESLNDALERKRGYKTQLLLETTAGQGSNLGHTFEQIAEILERIKEKDRIGVCIDSCHVFAAGYDITSRKGYQATMKHFDQVIGLRKVKAFHLNDSKTELGSKIDRHEHIGQGHLGMRAFRLIVNDERFHGIPMVLETPGDAEDFKRNLQTLKGMRSSPCRLGGTTNR
jgi:deoxyribonuclease-4